MNTFLLLSEYKDKSYKTSNIYKFVYVKRDPKIKHTPGRSINKR